MEQTVAHLFWWVSLPVELAYGTGGSPAPCTPLNSGTSLFRQTTLSLGAFLAVHPLIPIPSTISMLPKSFLSPDPFSQPHASALSPCQHQAGVPRADSQGGFGIVGTQAPRAFVGRGDPGLRGEWAHSDGSSSQCWRPRKLVVGERSYNGGSTPCAPLNNDALLLSYLRFFPQTFPVVELLTPVLSGCLFTANNYLLPGSAFQTSLSNTQPPFTTGNSQFRLEHAEVRCRACVQFLLCPDFHRPSAAFSFDPLKVLFYPS